MRDTNKNCLRGCLITISTIIFIPILFLAIITIVFTQQRHFQKVGNYDFTIYNHNGYVIPYKYYGLSKPSKNYIKASDRGGILLFIAPDSTIFIFPMLTYIASSNNVFIDLPDYKYKFFPDTCNTASSNVNPYEDSIQYCKKQGYPFVEYIFNKQPH